MKYFKTIFSERMDSGETNQETTLSSGQENVPPDRDSIVVIGVPSQRTTLVINYPSDSSSGDSSNRGNIYTIYTSFQCLMLYNRHFETIK